MGFTVHNWGMVDGVNGHWRDDRGVDWFVVVIDPGLMRNGGWYVLDIAG